MSALGEIARWQYEDELYGEVLEQVYKHLDKKSLPKEEKAIKLVSYLKLKDKRTWIRVLSDCKELSKYDLLNRFEKHKKNPLKGKSILDIDYGIGFVNMRGSIEQDISSHLKEKGMVVFDGDRYSILIDKKLLKNAEIVWRGHYSAKTPYKADRK